MTMIVAVGIDLTKNVFAVHGIDEHGKATLVRPAVRRDQLLELVAGLPPCLIGMEACSGAHHWARQFVALCHTVRLMAPKFVVPYRLSGKRGKNDAVDAAALIEALRCSDLQPVRVKCIEQQALQALHRARSLWMSTRTSRINALREFCREFGLCISAGSRLGLEQIARALADPGSGLPALLRPTMQQLIEEIRLLETRISQLERELAVVARESPACQTLLTVPGVGLLTATAMVAATSGSVAHFKDARHFASWFGLTPKESSSGQTRRLGRISKRGDRYLRMLLTHGARSVLRAAAAADNRGRPVDGLRRCALDIQGRSHHNRATCALANKMARICYAVLRDQAPFAGTPVPRKMRQTYALAN